MTVLLINVIFITVFGQVVFYNRASPVITPKDVLAKRTIRCTYLLSKERSPAYVYLTDCKTTRKPLNDIPKRKGTTLGCAFSFIKKLFYFSSISFFLILSLSIAFAFRQSILVILFSPRIFVSSPLSLLLISTIVSR